MTTENKTMHLVGLATAYRKQQLARPDMLGSTEAAAFVGITRATLNTWRWHGKVIACKGLKRGWKYPSWQFAPSIMQAIKPVRAALGGADGWQMLSFFETYLPAIQTTPRQYLASHPVTDFAALQRIVALADVEAH